MSTTGLRGALVLLLLCLGTAAACTEAPRTPVPPATTPAPTAVPAYDGSLPPARAVLALVPAAATSLGLVDLDQVRRQVGLPELTSRSSASDRAAFRTRARVAAPQVTQDLLGRVDLRLRSRYGFGRDDLAWEAGWSGPGVHGWALAFRPYVDMGAVRRAVRAGVGELANSRVDLADHLVVSGPSTPGPVWGSDPRWAALVPEPGEAFVVRRGCIDPAHLPDLSGSVSRLLPQLEPLDGFAVTFGDAVATVRVDGGRTDLFARVRLANRWSVGGRPFGAVYRHGVGDPSSGRIGYDVSSPARAAALARRGLLPFGVCAAGS